VFTPVISLITTQLTQFHFLYRNRQNFYRLIALGLKVSILTSYTCDINQVNVRRAILSDKGDKFESLYFAVFVTDLRGKYQY